MPERVLPFSQQGAVPRHAAGVQAWLPILLFALAYGASVRLGLAYTSLAPNVTLIWAPTGISLFVALRPVPA